MDYIVRIREDGVELLSKQGRSVSLDKAIEIVAALNRQFPSKCWVYIGWHQINGLWKIGLSHDVSRRASELRIVIKHTIECPSIIEAAELELLLHTYCEEQRVSGEWFSLTDEQIETLMDMGMDEGVDISVRAQAYDALFSEERLPERLRPNAIAAFLAAAGFYRKLHDWAIGKGEE